MATSAILASPRLREQAIETNISTFLELLKNENVGVRCHAASSLAKIGPDAKIAVPVLTVLLKDKDRDVRRAVALALGDIGFGARSAIPALTRLVDDKVSEVRRAARDAVKKINEAE